LEKSKVKATNPLTFFLPPPGILMEAYVNINKKSRKIT